MFTELGFQLSGKKQLKCFQQTVTVQQGKRNFIDVIFFLQNFTLIMIILMSVDFFKKKNSIKVFFQVNSSMMLSLLILT